jgi:hypothetical protein
MTATSICGQMASVLEMRTECTQACARIAQVSWSAAPADPPEIQVESLAMTAGPSDGMVPFDYGGMRASTADRERAVDVLKAAFAEGRLDQAEYADRVGLVYSSRTYAELAALTADLPIGPLGTMPSVPVRPALAWPETPPMPVPQTRPRTNGMAIAAFVFGLGGFVTGGITAPLALGLAIAAGIRIRRTGESGAGLVALAVVLVILEIVFFARFLI